MNIAKLFGAILIFSGTCIGAGMLSLPLQTASTGFIPTSIIFLIAWALMIIAGFLIIEVNLWFKDEDVNIISMAGDTLGISGKVIAWFCYVLIMIAANTAYIDAGSPLVSNIVQNTLHINFPDSYAAVLISLITGVIVFSGTGAVDGINRFLMVGLIGSYLTLTTLNIPHVKSNLLSHANLGQLRFTLPIIVASFTAHMVLPSLRKYLHSDLKSLKFVVILGCTLPLILYLFWELITLGIVPVKGAGGMLDINNSVDPVLRLSLALSNLTHNHWIGDLFAAFSGFALATSFLGISLSLADFLCDGFGWHQTRDKHFICTLLAIIPPLLIKLFYSKLFNVALNNAGYLIAIMLIILPAAMVYSGRYRTNLASNDSYRVFGGKTLLLVVGALGLVVLGSHY